MSKITETELEKEINHQASIVASLKESYLISRGNFLSSLFRSRKTDPDKPFWRDVRKLKKLYKMEQKKLQEMLEKLNKEEK